MSTAGIESLSGGVDAMEIKVTLDSDQIEDGLAAFDLPPQQAIRRRIWFCEQVAESGESAALPLLARGLILRLRSTDGDADLTVKLRGPEGCVDPESWRRRTRSAGKRAKIEGDWAGPRRLLSASLDAHVDDQQLAHVLRARDRPVSQLFSTIQDDLLREWLVPLDGFDLLGPVQAMKWDPVSRGLDHKVAAEMWLVDDGLRFLELSIRVKRDPEGAKQAFEGLVRDRHLEVPAQHETKTRMVLERLSNRDSRQ